ncbi:MAG: hypothetical protein IH830_03715 [Planctomycetes bacterium]|nr:hypothetical protein [Planctomycetota bacterium]
MTKQEDKNESRALALAQQLTAMALDLRSRARMGLKPEGGGFLISPGQERRIREEIDARSSEMLGCVDVLEQHSLSREIYLKVRDLRRHIDRREDSPDALLWIGQFQTLSDELDALLRASIAFGTAEGARHDPMPVGKSAGPIHDDAMMSPGQLALAFDVPAEALRGRLKRWRVKNPDADGWIEITKRAPREPQYLYRVGAVLVVIEDLKKKAPSETSSEQPPKGQ